MVFSFLKGGTDALKAAAARFKGKEFMEGCVAVVLMVGHADGEMEPAEKSKAFKILSNLEELKHFDPMDLKRTYDRGMAQFEIDVEIGNQWALKNIREAAAGDADGEKVATMLSIGTAIAKADGDLEDAEKKVIALIRDELGR